MQAAAAAGAVAAVASHAELESTGVRCAPGRQTAAFAAIVVAVAATVVIAVAEIGA